MENLKKKFNLEPRRLYQLSLLVCQTIILDGVNNIFLRDPPATSLILFQLQTEYLAIRFLLPYL